MAECPSRFYPVLFALIALVLGWVIVRDYILEPDPPRPNPDTAAETPG